ADWPDAPVARAVAPSTTGWEVADRPYHAPMAAPSTTSTTSDLRPGTSSSPSDPQQAVRDAGTMGPGFGPGSARELMTTDTFTGRPSVRGRQHVISSVHFLATMGGLQVLERGGNA